MKFNTKAIHGGQQNVDPGYGAVMSPIYQTSTFEQISPGQHKGFEYARSGNPTRSAYEKAIASLENGKHGLAFASGLAAIDAILKLLKPGDEVISTNDLYGGSYRLFNGIYKDLGIKFHFVNMQDPTAFLPYLTEHTKLIWAETPTNPLINILDLEALSKIAKTHNLLLAVDNTFATAYLQRPLEWGADIVMHSATKYLGGHSDLIMGSVVVSDDALAKKLYFIQNASGGIAGPMDSFLALRGLKTLPLRMQRHCENAKAVAEFLQQHPKVERVFWPGLSNHPQHDLATKQMLDYGGMVAFTTKGNSYTEALKFLERLKIFTLAESLGGVESLAGHPVTMTHASIPKADREKTGIVDSLIRLSVGIEDKTDLLLDLDKALG